MMYDIHSLFSLTLPHAYARHVSRLDRALYFNHECHIILFFFLTFSRCSSLFCTSSFVWKSPLQKFFFSPCVFFAISRLLLNTTQYFLRSVFFSVPFYFLRSFLLNIAQVRLFPLNSRRIFPSYSLYISKYGFLDHVVCLFLFVIFFLRFIYPCLVDFPYARHACMHTGTGLAFSRDLTYFSFFCCCCIVCYSSLHRQRFEFCCLPLQRRR